MKKSYRLPIVGAVCIAIGMLMATGIETNMWQGVYAMMFMGAGILCVHKWEQAQQPDAQEPDAQDLRAEELDYRKAA